MEIINCQQVRIMPIQWNTLVNYLRLKEYLILERMMWKVSHKIIANNWIYWHTALVKYTYHVLRLLKEEGVKKQKALLFPGWSTSSRGKNKVMHQNG